METLAELERLQTRILRRISDLERQSHDTHTQGFRSPSLAGADSDSDSDSLASTESRLSAILRANSVTDFSFKTVPPDYYDRPLEYRRDILGAASIDHLCKSIVLVNTQAPPSVTDCNDRYYSKYYVVVVQYTARFSAEAVKNFLYSLNNGKIPKKKFNMRLAPEEISCELTGYVHNAVTCVDMKTDIPVILDEAITKLNPDYFWLGGGEVLLKLRIKTSEFIDYAKPFIVNCNGK